MCSSPAAPAETVKPSLDLKQEAARCRSILKLWVSLGVDFLVQRNFRPDIKQLELYTAIRSRQLTQLCKVVKGFLIAAFGCQPTRREGQKDDADAKTKSREDLEEEGQSPCPLRCHIARAVSDPKSNDNSGDNAKLFEHKECTSDLWWGDLRNVKRCNHAQHTDAQSSDEPCYREHGIVDSSCLQRGTDGEDDDGNDDRIFAAVLVCDPALVQSTKQCAKLDHGCKQAFPKARIARTLVDPCEASQELLFSQDDGDYALVIAEKKTSKCCEHGAKGYVIGGEDSLEAGLAIGLSGLPDSTTVVHAWRLHGFVHGGLIAINLFVFHGVSLGFLMDWGGRVKQHKPSGEQESKCGSSWKREVWEAASLPRGLTLSSEGLPPAQPYFIRWSPVAEYVSSLRSILGEASQVEWSSAKL